MPPIMKDSETGTAAQDTSRSGSEAASTNDAAVRPQPVALEVPITVNGARTVEGSDKREPFSESTKTVMVHGAGAVIRLNSAMAPGQLLFLTNERTKKEVVCQVVKSKNYRNVNGYVELEFTEPAVGFWGMRFPGDRIGPGPQTAPAATRPLASGNGSSEHRAGNGNPSTIAAKPSVPAPVSAKPVSPTAPAPSIKAQPLDSAALLGGTKSKSSSNVPPAPALATLDSDAPLVEPWLKKREPAARIPAASPRAAAPEAPAKNEAPRAILPPARNFETARPSDQAASLFAPSEAPSNPATVDLSTLAPFFEVKPASPDVAPPPEAPVASDAQTQELKQHTARLQEELSKMQFAEPAAEPTIPWKAAEETPAAPVTELSVIEPKTEPVHESVVKLVENSGALNPHPLLGELPAIDEPAEPSEAVSKAAPSATIPALDSLEQEEMKIPAWLEPLARNTSAPSSTKELILREKTKRVTEQPALKEMMAPLAAPVVKERGAESRVPQFGSALPFEEKKSAREAPRKKSGKGMLVAALAAGILVLAGGGWWYMNQRGGGAHAGFSAAQTQPVSTTAQANSTKEAAMGTLLPTRSDSPAKPASADSHAPVNPAVSAAVNAPSVANRNAQTSPNSANSGRAAPTAASAVEPEPPVEKKAALGEVRLAAPKISQKRSAQGGTEPDPGISLSEDQPEASAESLGAGLAATGSQPAAPAAPVAVGGDVKQAKLISSVPPVYPALARTQHISGGVTVDALIDANGRVTTMKVISGPTLLQQAAMEALKQWKYQPAMLDGKAVPMHLTITVQFRLQ